MAENIPNHLEREQVITLSDIFEAICKSKKTILLFGIIFFVLGTLLATYRLLNPSYNYVANIQLATYLNSSNQMVLVQPAADVVNYIEYIANQKAGEFGLPIVPLTNDNVIKSSFDIKNIQNNIIFQITGSKKSNSNYIKFYQYIFSQVQELQNAAIGRNVQNIKTLIANSNNQIQLLNNQAKDLSALRNNANDTGNKINQFLPVAGKLNHDDTDTSRQILQSISGANLVRAYDNIGNRVVNLTMSINSIENQILSLQASTAALGSQLQSFQGPKLIDIQSYKNSSHLLLIILQFTLMGIMLGFFYIILKFFISGKEGSNV